MWTSTIILLLVGSLSAHPKGHLGGDEEITCLGIQELRKAPLAIISQLDCNENCSKDKCTASTTDVSKFCIDGLDIDVDCVEYPGMFLWRTRQHAAQSRNVGLFRREVG